MPKEVRYLLFSREEIITALVEYRRQQSCPLPPGNIVKMLADDKDGDVFVMLIIAENRGIRSDFSFTANDLLASLIYFCKTRFIPMPIRAVKGVERQGDAISLIATLNFTHSNLIATERSVVYSDPELEISKNQVKASSRDA